MLTLNPFGNIHSLNISTVITQDILFAFNLFFLLYLLKLGLHQPFKEFSGTTSKLSIHNMILIFFNSLCSLQFLTVTTTIATTITTTTTWFSVGYKHFCWRTIMSSYFIYNAWATLFSFSSLFTFLSFLLLLQFYNFTCQKNKNK